MTITIIITICTLLLLAYVFERTSSKTKVPAVILLLLLGFFVRQLTTFFEISIPDLTPILPFFGTVGLILIVLEGSLELEFNKSKTPLIKKSFLVSLFPLLALAFLLSFLFHHYGQFSFKDSLTNAVPLCIISSAIAIPSVKSLTSFNKEFIIYESSLSDIIGVLFFNFIALNDSFGFSSFGYFGLQLIAITVISFVATIGLAFMLNKIDHHIKFAPIILLVILIYAVSKVYHLPGLIFIFLFGLFMGNLDELKQFKWIEKLKPEELNTEVNKFKELTTEAAFLVRSLFFLLFGYLIQTEEILNTDTLIWAVGIVTAIYIFRAIQLKISKLSLSPLLFIAPRGLITILLFLTIGPEQSISLVNKSLIIQVIILTALIMMLGLMTNRKQQQE
ncbi:sodium/proton antiporter, CPA1 family [Flavobacterium fryxellicola]|uniref:Sodium:proton antiporter n=1 Tax=Flavobacterium fryxellicola TaxID=249352 RepID=A0A167ZEE3_9FLAO|nr:cation:proton antiporter [Flavobacterium fryxellicola]OAB30359.1 sodium:proton antiporter [Flavobacterium fryxellicola]SHN75953.1 sodium/proton antiporter, CPA1 family [Flavobacterium fryxellicola]